MVCGFRGGLFTGLVILFLFSLVFFFNLMEDAETLDLLAVSSKPLAPLSSSSSASLQSNSAQSNDENDQLDSKLSFDNNLHDLNGVDDAEYRAVNVEARQPAKDLKKKNERKQQQQPLSAETKSIDEHFSSIDDNLVIAHDFEKGKGKAGGKGDAAFHRYTHEQIENRMEDAIRSQNVEIEFFENAVASNRPRQGAIVALLAVRNVEQHVALLMRLATQVVDLVVVLDDASTDGSVAQVRQAARNISSNGAGAGAGGGGGNHNEEEGREQGGQVAAIIRKRQWARNEALDRNLLLLVGRALGGSYFVVLDYDEFFAAPCFVNDGGRYLRQRIRALPPGAKLAVSWRELWDGLDRERVDPDQPELNFLGRVLPVVFRDYEDPSPVAASARLLTRALGLVSADSSSSSGGGGGGNRRNDDNDDGSDISRRTRLYVLEKDSALKIHYPRIPVGHSTGKGSGAPVLFLDESERQCALLEFRFVSLPNVYLKRIWYAMFGRLHNATRRSLGKMNALLDEPRPTLRPAKRVWLADENLRAFASSFQCVEWWRAENIVQWLNDYGGHYFQDTIPMAEVDWPAVSQFLLRRRRGRGRRGHRSSSASSVDCEKELKSSPLANVQWNLSFMQSI